MVCMTDNLRIINQRDNQRKILMMHIYNDIIERNDGKSENNIIRGGMIMLRVDFIFDKKIIEKMDIQCQIFMKL